MNTIIVIKRVCFENLRIEVISQHLRDIAYFKTGGEADAIYAPSTAEELAEIVARLVREQTPYFLLGGGTNSLVMDDYFQGAVITFQNFNHFEIHDDHIECGAGVENSDLAQRALQANLSGVAWMNGLPGQLGGTVRMNARCYGGEISQVVVRVNSVTREGKVASYETPSVFRGYKDTIFMDQGDLITDVTLKLLPGDSQKIREKMDYCRQDREGKGQFAFPSCGCVFKNDYSAGVPSGQLIDAAGGKKLKVGGAEISPYHANFVYNKGATSRDILELSFQMRELVFEKFGVWLAYEMEILGHLPEDLRERVQESRDSDYNHSQLIHLRDEFSGRLKSAPEE